MNKEKVAIAFVLVFFSTMVFAQKFTVNTQKSIIEWTGKKIAGQHSGTIALQSGSFELKGNKLVSGSFVIDMTSITNTDISDESMNKKLVGHLKSDDFFGVEKYPTATFVVTKVSKLNNGKTLISGDITIKAKTEKISFEAENKGKEYIAKLEVDRSKFDVRYGSNSFFDNLGNKAIDNIFTLNIKLLLN